MSFFEIQNLNLNILEERLGYVFKNKKLLQEALTHSSYFFEHSPLLNAKVKDTQEQVHYNERLEFLGDSVLGLSASEYLFNHLHQVEEGVLTKQRALLVCEKTLVQVANSLNLGEFLLLGKGEEKNGGRQNISNLSNAVEAILGAVFLDADFETAKTLALRLLKPYLELAQAGKLIYDYKSKLLEWVQRSHHSSALKFELLETLGPDHAPQFKIALYLCDELLAVGISSSKKEAEQLASQEALKILEKENMECN